MRVLVAEDDLVLRHMVGTLLARRKISFEAVGDGASAVAAWRRGDFDLVLMDLQMPGVDGLDATRIIRDEERGSGGHIAIVAMTAHAQDKDRTACLEAGMDDFIVKPIEFDAFLSLLEKYGAGKGGR